ncbi:hypothetical protein [Streptosporangium sp. OZ121]|uniref:hypothetical protein n=1 Tax=Streptosporangium sp. OZ121 TaxID=3444183 RepID=UPI003F79DB38
MALTFGHRRERTVHHSGFDHLGRDQRRRQATAVGQQLRQLLLREDAEGDTGAD